MCDKGGQTPPGGLRMSRHCQQVTTYRRAEYGTDCRSKAVDVLQRVHAFQQFPVIADAALRREALQEDAAQQGFRVVPNVLAVHAGVGRKCLNQSAALGLERGDHPMPRRYGDLAGLEREREERLMASSSKRSFKRGDIIVVA